MGVHDSYRETIIGSKYNGNKGEGGGTILESLGMAMADLTSVTLQYTMDVMGMSLSQLKESTQQRGQSIVMALVSYSVATVAMQNKLDNFQLERGREVSLGPGRMYTNPFSFE